MKNQQTNSKQTNILRHLRKHELLEKNWLKIVISVIKQRRQWLRMITWHAYVYNDFPEHIIMKSSENMLHHIMMRLYYLVPRWTNKNYSTFCVILCSILILPQCSPVWGLHCHRKHDHSTDVLLMGRSTEDLLAR